MICEHETADTVIVVEVGTSPGQCDLYACGTPRDERRESSFSNTK
jgi:hypothetical protein